jgi:hypothetical protein
MGVPKMVKNGFKSAVAKGSLWICLMSVFWLCSNPKRDKKYFTPFSEQACALTNQEKHNVIIQKRAHLLERRFSTLFCNSFA